MMEYKKSISILWFCLVSTLSILSQRTTINNPILTGFYPDPSIVKVGPDYYLINSTFSYFPGLPIMHSKDLKNWQQIGNVINRNSQMDFMGERMTRGLFAPAISYYKGIFYVTCTDIDHDGNFVVTATNPAGPWSNPVKIPQVRGIDPSIYFDEETEKAYIVYNSDAPDRKPLYSGHRTIRMYEFDYKNLKVIGEEKQLVNGGVDISKKPVWIEGPHFYKKYGWYYLYAAEGGTSINHSQVVFRSKSIDGPYIPYENNPILTQRDLPADRKDPITSAGHAQFVEGPDGKLYSIFLAVRPYEGDFYNTGRETFLAPVTWKDEWPIINAESKEIKYHYTFDYKETKLKNTIPQNGNFNYTISFKKHLDFSWLFMRKYDSTLYSLSKKEGLILKLKPETINTFENPAFIGRRQQHISSSVETELGFSPTAPHEKAGLVIFQNEGHYYYLAKSVEENKPVIQLFKSNPSNKSMDLVKQAYIPPAWSKVKLLIQSSPKGYSFYYGDSKNNLKLLQDDLDVKFLSTKVAGGFIGCVYGFYGTSSGEKTENRASFNYFKYIGNDSMLN